MKHSVDSLQSKLDEFLKPLLSRAGFELSYELRKAENRHPEVENPDFTVNFFGADVDLLLANRAELLLALEHLSTEALHLSLEDHGVMSFDANDYRLLRVEELRMSAFAAADKVKRTRVPFHFSPMSSRERRIIHLALREEKDLRSESIGVGPARAVVILPADMQTPPAPPLPARGSHPGGRGNGMGRRGENRGGNRDRGGHPRGGGDRPFRGGRGRSPR